MSTTQPAVTLDSSLAFIICQQKTARVSPSLAIYDNPGYVSCLLINDANQGLNIGASLPVTSTSTATWAGTPGSAEITLGCPAARILA